MFKTIIFMAIFGLWIVDFWVEGSRARNTNDCPVLTSCTCKKAKASIRCTNIMEVPKLPQYIQKVELSHNSITELKRTDFNHNRITELHLDNNKITTVDEDAFINLTELKHINLSNNNIRELKENVFQNNKKLKQVYLENNLHLVFTATSLPASIEELNLFNTNSTLLYNQLPNVFGTSGRYHGNLYLNDERTRILEYQGTVIRSNEDLHNSSIITSTSTEKPKSTPTYTENTNANSATTMKPEEQSEVVPPQKQREMQSEIDHAFYLYFAFGFGFVAGSLIVLVVLLLVKMKNNVAHQTATGPRQEQEQRLVSN